MINTVSSTFYAYLASVEADKVAVRSIGAVKDELRQSKNRYEEGSALKSDVLSLEVQLAEAQDKLIDLARRHATEVAEDSAKRLEIILIFIYMNDIISKRNNFQKIS